ncbi:tRNA lysidine(34) synthetase TilS [Aquisediminimonas profunda]|uniref:tRNA lysidine(34) synthetase TilS n=1 Tax=Aquisediminimonas profunda TaxID=1550733 RepID=UPI001C6295EB|nr:tRNA lysidine(34) synthetase TilS [Aquisediminimonas profunda]
MQNALPEAAVERFRGDLQKLIPADGARLGVAVSGGPDSLALLLLSNCAFPGQCHAATVDHQLRAESRAEADYVGKICASLGIPHATLTPAKQITGSIQSAARAERYVLLDLWAEQNGLDAILTAHHADDQAETLLMRLNRGAGTGGLSGVRAINGRIVRPLLNWRRYELAEIVRLAGISPVLDPTNKDDRYDRVRIRKAIMGAGWLDPVAMARSATALTESDAALGWMADRLFAERVSQMDESIVLNDPLSLPLELQRRLLIRCIRALDGSWRENGPDVQRLSEKLRTGGKASIGRLTVRATPDSWEFTLAPPRRKN